MLFRHGLLVAEMGLLQRTVIPGRCWLIKVVVSIHVAHTGNIGAAHVLILRSMRGMGNV